MEWRNEEKTEERGEMRKRMKEWRIKRKGWEGEERNGESKERRERLDKRKLKDVSNVEGKKEGWKDWEERKDYMKGNWKNIKN